MLNSDTNKICNKFTILEENFYNFQTQESKEISIDDLLDNIDIDENSKVVICAGHYYIPNPEKPHIVSENSQKTWQTACKYVSELKNRGINAYLNLMLNDVELPVIDKDISKARQMIKDNFVFPREFKDIMNKYNLTEQDLIAQYTTKLGTISTQAKTYNNGKILEQRLVNKFSKVETTSFKRIFPNTYHKVKSQFKACSKAITQYLLELDRNGFDTLVFIVPGCTQNSLSNGYSILKRAITEETPTKGKPPEIKVYALYQTGCCYDS